MDIDGGTGVRTGGRAGKRESKLFELEDVSVNALGQPRIRNRGKVTGPRLGAKSAAPPVSLGVKRIKRSRTNREDAIYSAKSRRWKRLPVAGSRRGSAMTSSRIPAISGRLPMTRQRTRPSSADPPHPEERTNEWDDAHSYDNRGVTGAGVRSHSSASCTSSSASSPQNDTVLREQDDAPLSLCTLAGDIHPDPLGVGDALGVGSGLALRQLFIVRKSGGRR